MVDKMFYVGDKNTTLVLIVKKDGVPFDLSVGVDRIIEVVLRNESHTTLVTKTMDFYTTGTDGKIKCNIGVADFNESGIWSVQASIQIRPIIGARFNRWFTEIVFIHVGPHIYNQYDQNN